MEKFLQRAKHELQSAAIVEGTEFLLLLYEKGLGYSAINTARSMLSEILKKINNTEFGKHPNFHKNVEKNFPKQTSTTKIYRNI